MRRNDLLIALSLALAVIALYARTTGFDYVLYDDHEYVFENTKMKDGLSADNIRWAFTTFKLANWHPLTWVSYLIDAEMFGLRPGGFHLVNVLLHAANTVLLYALLRELTGSTWRSAMVAMLFGVHPLHVESVAWISERKDVLSTLFLLLAILAYARWTRADNRKKAAWSYGWLLVLFALGLLTKPMIVTLPGMLLLLDYWPLGRLDSWRQFGARISEKLPLIVMAAAMSIVTYIAQSTGGAVRPIEVVSLAQRCSNALVSYVAYLGKMLWPGGLAVPYPMREQIPAWQVIGSVLILVSITVAAVWLARTGRRYATVGWFWYLGTLVPVIGLVQVGDQAMADRYSYVPLIGPFIVLAWGGAELVRSKRAALAAGGAMLVVLWIVAYVQVGYWRDTHTLFTHAVIVNDKNWLAWHQLGLYYVDKKDYPAAQEMYERALRLRPKSGLVNYNYGNNLMRLGRLDDAKNYYERALITQPRLVRALSNLGILLAREGKTEEAIDLFTRAIAADSQFAEAHANLGRVFLQTGDLGGAEREFREAVRLSPGLAAAERGLHELRQLREQQTPVTIPAVPPQ